MTGEFISHFFLLPQTRPAAISCSIRSSRTDRRHAGGCWATYRSTARTTAESLTVHPSASDASCPIVWRSVSNAGVRVRERMTNGSFLGFDFVGAIYRVINSPGRGMLRGEQIVTRTTSGRAQCLYSSFDSDLSLSLKRDNFDAIPQEK